MRRAPLLACALAAVVTPGCGESRRAVGEECLRNEDCLSSVCAARTCVPLPGLVTGSSPPEDEEPRIPDGSAPIVDAATGDGGA